MQIAKNDLNNREEHMARVEDKIERDLLLVIGTAIEDKLQDQVRRLISCSREYRVFQARRRAGIKLWVLTGDKVDTAKNIGYSCRLLTNQGMELLQYPKDAPDLYLENLNLRKRQEAAIQAGLKTAVLVEGVTIARMARSEHIEMNELVVAYLVVRYFTARE
jgi:magnesium-transporting ATPase (P-type)